MPSFWIAILFLTQAVEVNEGLGGDLLYLSAILTKYVQQLLFRIWEHYH